MKGRKSMPQFMFHGCCHGCTQQELHGTEFCAGCRYFDTNWALPDLNNRAPTDVDRERIRIKSKVTSGVKGKDRQYLLTMPPPLMEKIRALLLLVGDGDVQRWRTEHCRAAAKVIDSQLCDCLTGLGDPI